MEELPQKIEEVIYSHSILGFDLYIHKKKRLYSSNWSSQCCIWESPNYSLDLWSKTWSTIVLQLHMIANIPMHAMPIAHQLDRKKLGFVHMSENSGLFWYSYENISLLMSTYTRFDSYILVLGVFGTEWCTGWQEVSLLQQQIFNESK